MVAGKVDGDLGVGLSDGGVKGQGHGAEEIEVEAVEVMEDSHAGFF